MPNRILREGILTSERVDALSAPAEVFYRRLMSVVDDFGRYYAKPELLLAALYPLRIERVRKADIATWIGATCEAGLVRKYTAQQKEYLELVDFRQQVRAKESKFPQPPSSSEADAARMHSTCIASAHVDGDVFVDVVEETAAREAEPVDNFVRQRGKSASMLRAAGVKISNQHPLLLAWIGELHATDAQLSEAIERARLNKPKPQAIPAAYLDPIVREVCAGVKARKMNGGAWWSSESAANAKGAAVGVTARPGESTEQFHGRIRAALAAQP